MPTTALEKIIRPITFEIKELSRIAMNREVFKDACRIKECTPEKYASAVLDYMEADFNLWSTIRKTYSELKGRKFHLDKEEEIIETID